MQNSEVRTRSPEFRSPEIPAVEFCILDSELPGPDFGGVE